MKSRIVVVRKGNTKVTFTEPCPWLVEAPSEAVKK